MLDEMDAVGAGEFIRILNYQQVPKIINRKI